MVAAFFSFHGRIGRARFLYLIQLTYGLGLIVVTLLGKLFFGTYLPPFPPFVADPAYAHQALFSVVPLLFSASLFVRRQRDRGHTPLLFVIFLALTIGGSLFPYGAPAPLASVPHSELQAFVARNVIYAPVTLLGCWLLFECCFLKGKPVGKDQKVTTLIEKHDEITA